MQRAGSRAAPSRSTHCLLGAPSDRTVLSSVVTTTSCAPWKRGKPSATTFKRRLSALGPGKRYPHPVLNSMYLLMYFFWHSALSHSTKHNSQCLLAFAFHSCSSFSCVWEPFFVFYFKPIISRMFLFHWPSPNILLCFVGLPKPHSPLRSFSSPGGPETSILHILLQTPHFPSSFLPNPSFPSFPLFLSSVELSVRLPETAVAPRRVFYLNWWRRRWSKPRLRFLRRCTFWSRWRPVPYLSTALNRVLLTPTSTGLALLP